MVTVSVSETYDLKTTPNAMSVLCVHTPDARILKNSYPGLHMNYRFFRFDSCDVKIACASMLPADPLQVGTDSGDIAPEDLFNPILYKAVSTEGMSNLEKRLTAMMNGDIGGNDIDGQSLDGSTSFFANGGTDFQRYYALLSNPQGWKMANPQAGLRMDGLYPLVYETWSNIGGPAEYPAVDTDGVEQPTPGQMTVKSFRGSAHRMPRLPTTVYSGKPGVGAGLSGLVAGNSQADLPTVPTVPVACIIMPPSRLHSLYYRMVIRWNVTYSEVRPLSDIADFEGLAYISTTTYGSDYTFAKGEDVKTTDMIDASGIDSISKVMSSGL